MHCLTPNRREIALNTTIETNRGETPWAVAGAPIRWDRGKLELLDQRLLPGVEQYVPIESWKHAGQAITDLVVRGAPAIGVTAAYGLVLAAQSEPDNLEEAASQLALARPTAVNLRWALDRLMALWRESEGDLVALEHAALEIHRATLAEDLAMARFGADLLPQDACVLTHCNTGALATGGYGTAIGVIKQAFEDGKIKRVYASETRPWWQGARLTAWELQRAGIPFDLVTEGAVAYLMAQGKVNCAIVGADRIVANGDVANKIGTYSAALNAYMHGIDFYVAAPTSTIDHQTASGDLIPIEQRSSEEILCVGDHRMAPADVTAWNPVFDITPAQYVAAIVTEKGVLQSDYVSAIRQLQSE